MFTLDEVREAIKDKPEFSLNLKEGYWNIDYNVEFETTFAGRNERESEILLNCRGTCFSLDGSISRLMYRKFKNLNQSPEYSAEHFDFSKPHRIEEKLDGSLISPIKISDTEWVLGTRAGVTEVSKKADAYLESLRSTEVEKYGHYIKFIDLCLHIGCTPLFEYVGRDNRIVIDYPSSKLILHGVRDMGTGMHIFDVSEFVYPFTLIDLVQVVADEHSSIKDLSAAVSSWAGTQEGVVVKFEDGRMVKIKSAEYCLFHSAVSSISLEKNLLKIVLENSLDDVIPLLQKDRQEQVVKYADSVNHFIRMHDVRVRYEFENALQRSQGIRKDFAMVVKENPRYSNALFKLLDGKEYSLREHALKNCGSSTDVESIRWLIGPSIDIF